MNAKIRRLSAPCARLRGSSFIEVMVAIVVFMTGSLGVLAFLGHGHVGILREGQSRIAAQVAHSRLETLRAVHYSQLDQHAEQAAAVALGRLTGVRATTVTPMDANGDGSTDYKHVRVTVSWLVGEALQEVSLVTLFAPTD